MYKTVVGCGRKPVQWVSRVIKVCTLKMEDGRRKKGKLAAVNGLSAHLPRPLESNRQSHNQFGKRDMAFSAHGKGRELARGGS